MDHFFKHVVKTPIAVNQWTTFKPFSKLMKGKGYSRGFVSCNAKATNDFIENRSLAYLIKTFCTPIMKGYFEEMDVEVREDLHALSEMIQWTWRSQIRRGDPATL